MLDWIKKESSVCSWQNLDAKILSLGSNYRPITVLKPYRIFQGMDYDVKLWYNFDSANYVITVGEHVKTEE